MPKETDVEELIGRARRLMAAGVKPFRSDADLIEFARTVAETRAAVATCAAGPRRMVALMAARMHDRIDLSLRGLRLAELFRRHRLSRIEREVALLMALRELGLAEFGGNPELLAASAGGAADRLRMARALRPEGRLIRKGLIEIEICGPFGEHPKAASELIGALTSRRDAGACAVRGQDELLDRSHALFDALRERGSAIGMARDFARRAEIEPCNRRVRRDAAAFWRIVERYPRWPLHQMRRARLSDSEAQIVILLIGKELGFSDPGDDLFTGEGLAQCASESIPQIRHTLKLLGGRSRLRAEGLVRACGGRAGGPAIEDEAALRSCEFELTPEALKRFGVPSRRSRPTRNRPHRPLARLDDLALGDAARRAIRMALAQMANRELLFDGWGLGAKFGYGRGLTMLFAGPPGVGKTATAEAIAHELGRPIITANYAELQSCWVGETEKNIARIFSEAAEANAVLFFDEADAMFHSREAATQPWEAREVNVLLERIEKFDGLCVLATNRKLALDPALERRIAIKVEFERPTAAMRKPIWKKLLPKRIPLARDVDLDRLAAAELSGGEIKNVIWNAARLALARTPAGPLTAVDFEEALAMETGARWSGKTARPIGFDRGRAIELAADGGRRRRR